MKLTTENVKNIIMDCLFTEEEMKKYTQKELMQKAVKVKGVITEFGLNPDRIKTHKEDIMKMLNQLPDEFHKNTGGGWSFLNACNTKDGTQWGEHRNMEELFVLGIASNQAAYLMPRELWKSLPGGMPYLVVGDFEEGELDENHVYGANLGPMFDLPEDVDL
jgi:hypothetical protein